VVIFVFIGVAKKRKVVKLLPGINFDSAAHKIVTL
jgi:hypothetical protein